eukprot:1672453-Rhodomonas_salina.1
MPYPSFSDIPVRFSDVLLHNTTLSAAEIQQLAEEGRSAHPDAIVDSDKTQELPTRCAARGKHSVYSLTTQRSQAPSRHLSFLKASELPPGI